MTVIIGVHSQPEIYLVSDTRVTYGDGSHEDDFIKFVPLSQNTGLVVAGSVHLAQHLKSVIAGMLPPDADILDIASLLSRDTFGRILFDYVDQNNPWTTESGAMVTGAYIFAGFSKKQCARVNADRYGNLLSKAQQMMEWHVTPGAHDPILSAIVDEINNKGGYLPPGSEVDVPQLPYSAMFSVRVTSIHPAAPEFEIEHVPVFGYDVCHPNQRTQVVSIPDSAIVPLAIPGMPSGHHDPAGSQFILDFIADTIKHVSVGGAFLPIILNPQMGPYFLERTLVAHDAPNDKMAQRIVTEGDNVKGIKMDGTSFGYRHFWQIANEQNMTL